MRSWVYIGVEGVTYLCNGGKGQPGVKGKYELKWLVVKGHLKQVVCFVLVLFRNIEDLKRHISSHDLLYTIYTSYLEGHDPWYGSLMIILLMG